MVLPRHCTAFSGKKFTTPFKSINTCHKPFLLNLSNHIKVVHCEVQVGFQDKPVPIDHDISCHVRVCLARVNRLMGTSTDDRCSRMNCWCLTCWSLLWIVDAWPTWSNPFRCSWVAACHFQLSLLLTLPWLAKVLLLLLVGFHSESVLEHLAC